MHHTLYNEYKVDKALIVGLAHKFKKFRFKTKSEWSLSEFDKFKPRLKSPQNRLKSLKNLIQISVEPTIFEPRLKFKPWIKFFKFDLWIRRIDLINRVNKFYIFGGKWFLDT